MDGFRSSAGAESSCASPPPSSVAEAASWSPARVHAVDVAAPAYASSYGFAFGRFASAGAGATLARSIFVSLGRIKNRTTVDQAMREGADAFRRGEYAQAEDRLTGAVGLDGDNGLIRIAHAHTLLALGSYEDASRELRRGLDATPEWVSSGNFFPAMYAQVDELQALRAALVEHVRAHPEDEEALAVLGYVDFFSGDLASARVAFERLRKARPDDPLAPHFLVEIERQMETHAGASDLAGH